ncbi:Mss4-like protein [Choanephora cucurbitarum]|nr:Mss4-like protein [Choanephora cucurbitarum]KAI8350919.1 Mss4-like protein [Choanephora cucurbitarum]
MATSNPSDSTFYGSCLCKSVKVTLSGLPAKTVTCNCSGCQTSSGGANQVCALYPKDKVKIDDSQNFMKKYTFPPGSTNSGNGKDKWFCSNCGTNIYNYLLAYEDLYVVRTSILDAPEGHTGSPMNLFPPTVEFFTANRPSFAYPMKGAEQLLAE